MSTSLFALLWLGIAGWSAETVNFDSVRAGEKPPGWTFAMTHRGAPPNWSVYPDPTAPSKPNVLAQLSSERYRYRFPLAVFDKVTCRNGDLSVKLKVVSTKGEQSAGLIWRYQDVNNYYLVRANAGEDNIVCFRVQNGKAESIPPLGMSPATFGVRHDIDDRQWNILKVTFRDEKIAVYFDHRKVLEARDGAITQPGKTGLWTKGDTVAYFDDFRIDRKN